MLIKSERRELIVPGDTEATLAFCLEHFIAACETAIADNGHFFVALSGGSTPKVIFERLCKPPYKERIEWSKVYLFWSDERSVPPENKESNYHMAMEAGFKSVPVPPEHIHRMVAEKDIEQNALNYEKTIRKVLGSHPFDLIMLGMGEDGHTASLFPGTEGLKAKGRLAIANHIPQKNTWRMTLTFECINQAKNIAVYVLGAGKKEKLAEVFSTDRLYPCQEAGTKVNKALWIADEAAASLLK